MNKIFSSLMLAFALALGGFGASSPASAGGMAPPVCNQQPGDYFSSADGKCHHKGGPGAPAPVPGLPAQHLPPDPAKQAFVADCNAHNGKVYTAEQWNHIAGTSLPPGALHCHAGGTWAVDPPHG